MNNRRKKWGLIFVILLAGLLATFYLSTPKATSHTIEANGITGAVTNQRDAQICFDLLEKNLTAASNKDIETYIDTLVSSAHEETAQEMTTFFDTYTLAHTLLSFEIVKQEASSMLVAAQQQTINLGENSYRNHITQAHHTFVKEGAAWKIQQTVMTNTSFID